MRLSIAVFAACVMLTGCAGLGLTVDASTQAKTVGEATQAAALAERAVDLYVKTGHPSAAVLNELQTLVSALHAPLVAAENANRAGNSAATAAGLSAFNEALAAYQAYAANHGATP